MRAIFSVVGLVLVVAIVGILVKKQLGAGVAPAPAAVESPAAGVARPTGTPQQQVQQFQKAVEGAMQTAPRQMPDDSN